MRSNRAWIKFNDQETATVTTPPTTNASTQNIHTISRGRLNLLRAGWLLTAVIYLAFYILSIPPMVSSLLRDATALYADGLPRLGMTPDSITSLFISLNLILPITCTLVSLLIFWQRSHDWVALIISMGLLTFPIHVGRAAIGFAQFYPDLWWIPSALRIYSGVFILGFLALFPNGRFVPNRLAQLYLGFGTLFILPIVHDIRHYASGQPSTLPAVLNAVYVLIGVGMQAWRYRYRATRTERQQTKWVIYAFFVAASTLTPFTILDAFVPALLHDYPTTHLIYRITANTLLLFIPTNIIPISMAIAITRSRLWDIDLIINRSLVVALTTLTLAGVFVGFVVGVRTLTGDWLDGVPFVGGVLLAGVLFDPARRRIQNLLDRRLYRWRFDLFQLAKAERANHRAAFGVWTGQKLGGYQIEALIGRGAMGEVYRASKDGQTVALKTVLATASTEHTQRFQREAEAMAGLNHPNIVRFYAAGDAPQPFIAMEWVDGISLDTLMQQRGALPLNDTLLILSGTAAALDHAHAQGIIHRDLKPANILLRASRDGSTPVPMLVDFGVAKFSGGDTLTGSGAIGTILYMAPEQIQSSKAVTPRADLYALGVILYEMLSGQPPFGGNPAYVLFAHLQQPPPDIRKHNPTLPPAVSAVIARAMAKDAEQRWGSAAEMLNALRAASA